MFRVNEGPSCWAEGDRCLTRRRPEITVRFQPTDNILLDAVCLNRLSFNIVENFLTFVSSYSNSHISTLDFLD